MGTDHKFGMNWIRNPKFLLNRTKQDLGPLPVSPTRNAVDLPCPDELLNCPRPYLRMGSTCANPSRDLLQAVKNPGLALRMIALGYTEPLAGHEHQCATRASRTTSYVVGSGSIGCLSTDQGGVGVGSGCG